MTTPQSPIHLLRRGGALAALAAALLAPAPASAGEIVSAGPGGSAHFGFMPGSASGLVYERTLGGDGSLGPAQPISWAFRYGYNPSIGVDASGTALIAWTSADSRIPTAYVRRRAADGSLAASQRLSPAGVAVSHLKLAVEPDGDAVAIWKRDLNGFDVIQARRRAADGTLGPIHTVSYGAANAADPDVALAPNGAATLTWLRTIGGENAVQTRTLAPDGTLGSYQRVSPQGGPASDASVTVNDAGRAVFAWMRVVGDGKRLETRARAATGTLGAVQIISDDPYTSPPAMAANAAGRVAFAWAKQINGTTWAAHGRIRKTDGSFGPRFDIGEASSSRPAVAVDPDGHVTFAWRRDGTFDEIQTLRRTFSGAMGQTRTVSAPAASGSGPQLVVDGGGKATIAWYDAGSTHYQARTVTPGGTVSAIHDLESDG